MSEPRKTRKPHPAPVEVPASGFVEKPLDVVIVTDQDHEKGPNE